MSDLVERLRTHKEAIYGGAGYATVVGRIPDRLCQEAADRIEALEAKLDALVKAAEPFDATGAASDPDWYTTNRAVAELECEHWARLSSALQQAKDAP